MSCSVTFPYRSYWTFSYKQIGSIRSIAFYPLQKLQELVFVKEVYKSDKRKSQHTMLTFFGSLSTVVGDEKLTSREDRIGPLFIYV